MFTKAFPTTTSSTDVDPSTGRRAEADPATATATAPIARDDARRARSPRRRTAALLAGPLLTTAGLAATPWETEKTTIAYHQSLAAAPDQAQIAALLLAFGYSLMGLAAIVVLRNAAPRFRKHLAVAAVLSWLGATLMPGLLVTDWYDLSLAQNLPAEQAAHVSEATQEYAFGVFLMLPAMLGFVAGPIAVLTLAVRSKLVGAWAPILAVLGIPMAMASISPVVMVASGLSLVVTYGGVALGLARRDRQRTGAAAAATPSTDPALDAVAIANRGRRAGAAA